MNRKLLSTAVTIVVITAALAVAIPLIQLGMASQSQTDSETDYGTECYVIATSTGASTMINVPPVSFQFDPDKNVYVPLKPLDDSTKGVLNVHIPGDDPSRSAKLRVMISFAEPLSWALIEEIVLELKPTQGQYVSYTLYDSSASASNGVASNPTLAIEVKDGQYDFRMRVAYAPEIKMDPRPYQGNNMVSNVLFIIEQTTDPMKSKTMTVILNDGGGDKRIQTVDMANSILIRNPFSKAGSTFAGWKLYKVNDVIYEGEKYYDDRDNIAYWLVNDKSSVELKADWGKKVEYRGGEGSYGTMSEQAVGERSVTLEPLGFTKQGYTFSKWVDNPSSPTVEYWYEAGHNEIPAGLANDLVLRAVWIENQVVVTFNDNGSTSGSMENQTISYTDEFHVLHQNAYEKTGNVFLGWNTKADGTGLFYRDEADLTNYIRVNTGALTLYAQWAQTYTITPEADHGTITFTPHSPVKAGIVVTINVQHEEGYITDTVTAMCGGQPISIVNERFVMPEGNVTVTATFKRVIDTATVTVTPASANTGERTTPPAVSVTIDAVTLTLDTDYTLAWTKDGEEVHTFTAKGEYTVTVTGAGSYSGTATGTFVVSDPEPDP